MRTIKIAFLAHENSLVDSNHFALFFPFNFYYKSENTNLKFTHTDFQLKFVFLFMQNIYWFDFDLFEMFFLDLNILPQLQLSNNYHEVE